MTRARRKYAAYWRKRGTRRWKRLHPDIQGSKDSTLHLYQTWLINLAFDSNVEAAIRSVPRKKVS